VRGDTFVLGHSFDRWVTHGPFQPDQSLTTARTFLIKELIKDRMTINVAHCMDFDLLEKTIGSSPEYSYARSVVVGLPRCFLVHLTLDTTGSTGIGDPGGSIGLRGASERRAGSEKEREGKALGAARARGE